VLIPLRSAFTKLAVLSAGIAGAAYLSLHIGRHAFVSWCIGQGTSRSLNVALKLEPDNCDAMARLGSYYAFSYEDPHPEEGLSFSQKAVRCQPLRAQYWAALTTVSEVGHVEDGFGPAWRSVALAPYYTPYLMRSANLMIYAGRLEDGLDLYYRGLEGSPELAPQVFAIYWRATQDGETILRRGVPDRTDINLAYLDFLASPPRRQLDSARFVWDRLISSGKFFPAQMTFPYLDALLESGRTDEALVRWNQLVLAGLLSRGEWHDDVDSIVNGGFEVDPANGGLDWRMATAPGVNIYIDKQVRHGGHQSLAIHFEGLTNIYFQHLEQIVLVKPNRKYRLSAYMKSRALTTLAGPHIEVFDPNDDTRLHWETADVLGTTEWAEYALSLRTGPGTKALTVRVVRKPAVELEKRIEGTLWLDDFELVPEDTPLPKN